jgi:IS605 OrfB family transposase
MITIKKKHNIDDDYFLNLLNKYNNVIRFSYNRIIKDKITKYSELERIVKDKMLNIECLDASWIKSAVKKSTELQTETKLYFGGKNNFFKRKYKKIDLLDKNFPIEMRGSSNDKGNRKASLVSNKFIFKPVKGIKYEIDLKLSKNENKMLSIIEDESKLYKNYFNFKIDKQYIYISFNEPILNIYKSKNNRYLGIDLNPNWIALSIQDIDKEVFKEIIDLKLLNKQTTNKKQHELVELNKHIISLCKNYKVEYVFLEDLNIRSSNKNKGRRFNKLLNNDWNRNYTVNNLVKQLNINSIKYRLVNPFYTSFIGQIKDLNEYDSVAASKEIVHRGYLMINNYNVNDYVNSFLSNLVSTHWKKMISEVSTYKDLYDYYKSKSKTSYRFLFNDIEKLKFSSLRLKFHKSMVDLIRI